MPPKPRFPAEKNSFLLFEQKIAQYFKHKPEVIAVFLFGSRASGKARMDSDIDLAIVFRHNAKSMIESYLDDYLMQLSRMTRKDMHIIALNISGENIIKQVLEKGKCIVCNDQKELSKFKMIAQSLILEFSKHKELMQKGFYYNIIGG